MAGRFHPSRLTGHDNLGDWRVDHPLAPELVEEAACIAKQADPDILAIEDHTIVALHFFMKRFVDSMDVAPLSHWRTYSQKHGRQGEEDPRSEERRVVKECVSTCRYRGSPFH